MIGRYETGYAFAIHRIMAVYPQKLSLHQFCVQGKKEYKFTLREKQTDLIASEYTLLEALGNAGV